MTEETPSHGDPGVQPERTSLAWGRTMIALFAAGALLLRWGAPYGVPLISAVAVAMMTGYAILITQQWRLRRMVRSLLEPPAAPNGVSSFLLMVSAVIIGAIGVTCIALDRLSSI